MEAKCKGPGPCLETACETCDVCKRPMCADHFITIPPAARISPKVVHLCIECDR